MTLTESQAAPGCLTAALQSQGKETAWDGTQPLWAEMDGRPLLNLSPEGYQWRITAD